MQAEKLVELCINGDDLAQKMLYESHKVKMFMICLRYSNDKSEAEDMLQEGFIKIYKDLKQYKGTGSLGAWMSRVMVHAALSYLRKWKGKYMFLEENLHSYSYTAPENTYANIGAKEITNMIQLLPQGYKTVFNLYVIDGYSHKEIADMLDISESTSKTQLFKAKKTLKNMLEVYILN